MKDKKDIIVVKDKDQANQIFEEMKNREADRLNSDYKITMQFLTEVLNKLRLPEKMVKDLKDIEDLKQSINERIDTYSNMALTMPESCHFEENNHLVKRNNDLYKEAIKSLKKSLKVIKGRIRIMETKEPEAADMIHLLTIPTKASPNQILDFWFKLQGNNEKGLPYWESEKEIEHFVYQNFEGFPGVNEIKVFSPNMNRTELYQVTWTFLDLYGISKGKQQYVELLLQNFTKLNGAKNVYGNIKDQNRPHLKNLFK